MRHQATSTEPARRTPSGRRWTAGVVMAVASALAAFPTGVSSAATSHARAVVRFERTAGPLGTVLVSGRGQTLYVDIHDHADRVTCTAACARSWPPLLLARGSTRPAAGAGVKGLGVVRRPGHRLQVTWHKHPLYLFAGDVRPGLAVGEGVGSTFFVVTPSGVLRSAPSTVPTPTSAPTTTTGSPAPTAAATPLPTTPAPGETIQGGTTGPAATSPPVTSPPAASPPPTSPPVTSPPPTTPPTTVPAGGGVAY